MFQPSVLAFPSPLCRLQRKYGSHDDCGHLVDTHHYNHLVSVVVPGTVSLPEDVLQCLNEDTDYYRATSVPIIDLVRKDFVDHFIRKGQLFVLSDNTLIDVDDCVCVTPSGLLVLSLQRDTYLQLGLEGKPSQFCKGKLPTRYMVTVDMKAPHFIPGKKSYERVCWCLEHKLRQRFNLLVAWEPPAETVCPSSVAAYLESRGHAVAVCKPKAVQRLSYNVPLPRMDPARAMDLLEWLGAFALGVHLDLPADGDSDVCSQVFYLQWTGYFTAVKIRRLFDVLRHYVAGNADSPWVAMYVQGFADSPISWALAEHSFFTSGDNDYALFLNSHNSLTLSLQNSSKCAKVAT